MSTPNSSNQGAAASGPNNIPSFDWGGDMSNMNFGFSSAPLLPTMSSASPVPTTPVMTSKGVKKCPNCEGERIKYIEGAKKMEKKYKDSLGKKDQKFTNMETAHTNAMNGQRESYQVLIKSQQERIGTLEKQLKDSQAEVTKLQDETEKADAAHEDEVAETIAAYEKDEKKLRNRIEELEDKLKNTRKGDNVFAKQIEDAMDVMQSTGEEYERNASTFIPDCVKEVLQLKKSQDAIDDLIKAATETLLQVDYQVGEGGYVEESVQVILELVSQRNNLTRERNGFVQQIRHAAITANISCAENEVIPNLVQIAADLNTQLKNAQGFTEKMANHAEEVRTLNGMVDDEKKIASDCRKEVVRLEEVIKGHTEAAKKHGEAVFTLKGMIEGLEDTLKVEREKVRQLEGGVKSQETNEVKIGALEDTIKGLKDDAAKHEEEVSKLNETIQSQNGAVVGQGQIVQELQQTIQGHEKRIEELEMSEKELIKQLQAEQTACEGVRSIVQSYEKDIRGAMSTTGYEGTTPLQYIHDTAVWIHKYFNIEKAAKEQISDLEKKVSDLEIDVDAEKAFAELAADDAKEDIDELKKELAALKGNNKSSANEAQASNVLSTSVTDQSPDEFSTAKSQAAIPTTHPTETHPATEFPSGPTIPTIQVTQVDEKTSATTTGAKDDDEKSTKITALEEKVANLEQKAKTLSGTIKYYQKENRIRYSKQKEYVYGIYTGQTSPKLIYGKEEYDSACLNLIGKKSYLQLQLQGFKNEKVENMIAAALPTPPTGSRKRGGRRGNARQAKDGGIPTIKEEVKEPAKKKANVEKELFEESDHEEALRGLKPLPTLLENYKSTFSDVFDAEKLAERKERIEFEAKEFEKRWASQKAELLKSIPKISNQTSIDNTQSATSSHTPIPGIIITPVSTVSSTTNTPSAPALVTTSPTTPTTATVATPKAWSLSSILGWMTGW